MMAPQGKVRIYEDAQELKLLVKMNADKVGGGGRGRSGEGGERPAADGGCSRKLKT